MNRPVNAREAVAPDRWQFVRQVLADAIDCPVAERRALLDFRCADDPELRREVESLLLAHDAAGVVDHLAPLVKPPSAWMAPPATEWIGRRTAQYLVQDALGAGGMGVVYRARDERLGRQVALKFLPPHLSADSDAKSRLVAEARAAAALDHPSVCTIYEIGETEDGQLFIAMPLYDGETLLARLQRGRLRFEEALPIALQVASGLGHAHDCGIVHLDVKPSNIVILPAGTAKILDFGIAQIHGQSLDDRQPLIGTIAYMSPEQASARPVDGRADVWSLGIVLHEMLAGVRPFHGDGRAMLNAILERDPNLTATSYPDVPAGIDRVLRRALAKAPDQRYASMSLLAAELSVLATSDGSGRQSGDDRMPCYIIERSVPGLTRQELAAAGRRSAAALDELPEVRWIRSYVSDAAGKMYCEYDAPSIEAIREHARRAGLPADRISEVSLEINPAMFV